MHIQICSPVCMPWLHLQIEAHAKRSFEYLLLKLMTRAQTWMTPCVLELISNLKLQILEWYINSQNKYIMRHFTDKTTKKCMWNSRGCQHVAWNKNSSLDRPQRSWFCMGCLENQQCSAHIKKSIVLKPQSRDMFKRLFGYSQIVVKVSLTTSECIGCSKIITKREAVGRSGLPWSGLYVGHASYCSFSIFCQAV